MAPSTSPAKPGAAKARPPARKTLPAPPVAKKAATKVAKRVVPAPAAKAVKLKAKLVRDSFTMPQADFDLVARLKGRALGFQRPTKKSELLRAGLQVLQALDDGRLRAALDALVPLKPGRPKKPG